MPDTKDKDVRQEPLTHSGTVVDHGDARNCQILWLG